MPIYIKEQNGTFNHYENCTVYNGVPQTHHQPQEHDIEDIVPVEVTEQPHQSVITPDSTNQAILYLLFLFCCCSISAGITLGTSHFALYFYIELNLRFCTRRTNRNLAECANQRQASKNKNCSCPIRTQNLLQSAQS